MKLLLSILILIILADSSICQIDQTNYIGCYADQTYDRDLPYFINFANMTVQYCFNRCSQLGYYYAGLQYSTECYCGYSFGKYGKINESLCSYKCQGNSSQVCGGLSANSIWRVNSFITSPVTITIPTTTTSIDISTAEWGILVIGTAFNTTLPLVRLFDLTDINVYVNGNYNPSTQAVEIGLLLSSVYTKKSLLINQALFPVKTMLLLWKNPMLTILINCQSAGAIQFTSQNEIVAMSLPSRNPQVILSNVNAQYFPTMVLAMVQAGCIDPNYVSPTTINPTAPTTTLTTSATTSQTTTSAQAANITIAEWAVSVNSTFFTTSLPIQRIFDITTTNVFISANYNFSSQQVEIGLLISNIYSFNTIPISQALRPINVMLIVWRNPSLTVLVNCITAGSLLFTNQNEITTMSFPYLSPQLLIPYQNTMFFPTVQTALNLYGCTNQISSSSTTTTPNPLTTLTTSTAFSSVTTTLPPSPAANLSNAEWAVLISPSVFLSNLPVIRLFDLTANSIYINGNYNPSTQIIDIGLLISNTYSKKSLQVNQTLLPVISMLLLWKSPSLVVLVNCKSAGSILFTSQNELTSMSLPYLDPNVIVSNGNNVFYSTVTSALVQSGCVDNNFVFPTYSASTNTTTASTTVSTTASTTTITNSTLPTTSSTPSFSSSTITSTVPQPGDITAAEWGILILGNAFNTSAALVRLFDITATSIYISGNYNPTTQAIEIGLLLSNIFSTRSLQINQTLFPVINMLVLWRNPLFVVFINCKNAGSILFSVQNEITSMSIPYLNSQNILTYSNSLFYPTIRIALIQAGCADQNIVFPTYSTSVTTTTSTTTTSTTTLSLFPTFTTPTATATTTSNSSIFTLFPTTATTTLIPQPANTTASEWGVYVQASVFNTTLGLVRLFDISASNIYITANYNFSAQSIVIGVLAGNLYTTKSLQTTQPVSSITNMLLLWRNPTLTVLLNCNNVGSILFSNPNEITSMSLPYLDSSLILTYTNRQFFSTTKAALSQAQCVDPNVFTTATSTTTTSTLTLTNITTATTTVLSNVTTAPQPANITSAQWGIMIPGSAFITTSLPMVRLFDLAISVIFVTSNYNPAFSNVEVNMLISNYFVKKTLQINQTTPINNMLITWKIPFLVFYINCINVGSINFINQNEITALSLPYLDPTVILPYGNGKFYSTVSQTLASNGCPNQNLTLSIVSSTIMASPELIPNGINISQLKSSLTPTSTVNSTESLDNDLILLIYNTRISQYRNLLSLQQLITNYQKLNQRMFNLTYYNCY